jgi:high-affinity Fe2+/Pb2+ permease
MIINIFFKITGAILLLVGILLAWWGWQHMDAASLLMGTRLC